jgi:hypothetical protein
VSYFTLRTSLILKETIKDLYKRPIMKAAAAPVGTPWMWTLAFGHHKDPTPTHGYEATREAAMAAFAKSWRRESTMTTRVIALIAMVTCLSVTAQAADTTLTLACKGTETRGGGTRKSSEAIDIGIIVDSASYLPAHNLKEAIARGNCPYHGGSTKSRTSGANPVPIRATKRC